jgi:PAS domain S-box-containing protein
VRSVRRYLVAISLFLVALVLAAALLLVSEVERASRRQAEQQLLATTRALSLVVDGELKRYEGIVRVLAASDRVAARDWPAVDAQGRRMLPEDDAWLVVSDRNGRQLVNTRLPPGSPLPAGGAPPEMWRELASNGSRICNLARGRVEPNILCIDVAVPSQDAPELALSVIMRPGQLSTILQRQQVPKGTFATVIDRRGIVVWRNVAGERFIGSPATRDIRHALKSRREGVQESRSLEGVPTVAAFSRSPYSGWTFIVAVPRSALQASADALPIALGVAASLILIAAGIGLIAGRRLTRAMRSLAKSADSIERGAVPKHEPTGFEEIDSVGSALEAAIQARKLSEDRYRRIFEQSSDLILTADLNQTITDCNESAAAAVGVPREQAIGRNISEFVSPEDFSRTTDMLTRKLKAGGTTQYDVRVRNNKGEWLYWEINSGLMHDADGTSLGLHVVGRDVTERKRSEERQQLLINELNHRVKNTLAIVQALAHQSFKGDRASEEEKAAFASRLATLASAHNLLTRESWEPVGLQEVIEATVSAVCSEESQRVRTDGPPVILTPQSAVSVAMAVHELCTNAVKYGALSSSEGQVMARWSIEDGARGRRLHLEWIEQGGPPVEPPTRRGFGTRMIERALAADLDANVELDFRPGGLVCRVDAPLPQSAP